MTTDDMKHFLNNPKPINNDKKLNIAFYKIAIEEKKKDEILLQKIYTN
jgi:hypothetical protein